MCRIYTCITCETCITDVHTCITCVIQKKTIHVLHMYHTYGSVCNRRYALSQNRCIGMSVTYQKLGSVF